MVNFTWLWSKIYNNKSAANVTPERPLPSLQCIKTGGFELWPGGISPIDASFTELSSSIKPKIKKLNFKKC